METITGLQTFLWEFFGAVILILLGNGVCAVINLRTIRVVNAGWLGITFEWGLAVPIGTSIVDVSGGYLNPAVTVTLALDDTTGWNLVLHYVTGQLLGVFVNTTLAWVTSKQSLDASDIDDNSNPINANVETDGNFFTTPLRPSDFWNTVTELPATLVLPSFILLGLTGDELGPLKYFGVSFIIVPIGLSLDSLTGHAISPARDLGPRLAYAFVPPIKGKGDANWSYAWVPIVAPMLAAVAIDALALAI